MLSETELKQFATLKGQVSSELEFHMVLLMRVLNHKFEGFYDYQQKTIQRVNDLLDREDTHIMQLAIAGANGIGKTHLIVNLLTFLSFWGWKDQMVKIVCLSGKYEQLITTLFRELKDNLKILDSYKTNGKPSMSSTLLIQNDKIINMKYNVTCHALSWDIANPEKIKGVHADSEGLVVVILDECTAIPDVIIENIVTTVAGSKGLILATANPHTKNNSFYRFFNSPSTVKQSVSIFDLPEERQKDFKPFIRMIDETYGIDSYQYKTMIMGKFSDDNSISLFPSLWIENAFNRESKGTCYKPFVLGVDIAGGTLKGDFSVICVRQGSNLIEILKTHQELPEFKQTIMRYIDRFSFQDFYGRKTSPVVGIDACGLGLAVVQALERYPNYRINRVQGSNKGDESFYNMRLLLYNKLRDWLEYACLSDFKYISPTGSDVTRGYSANNPIKEEIKRQMLEVEMVDELKGGESTGRFKLGKKVDMHKTSPDILDALSYTCVQDTEQASSLTRHMTPSQGVREEFYD